MMDLMKTLDARRQEIGDYISASNSERESLIARLSELDQGVAQAERDVERIRRAMNALEGSDEPKNMTAMVDQLMPSPVRGQGYSPKVSER